MNHIIAYIPVNVYTGHIKRWSELRSYAENELILIKASALEIYEMASPSLFHSLMTVHMPLPNPCHLSFQHHK